MGFSLLFPGTVGEMERIFLKVVVLINGFGLNIETLHTDLKIDNLMDY